MARSAFHRLHYLLGLLKVPVLDTTILGMVFLSTTLLYVYATRPWSNRTMRLSTTIPGTVVFNRLQYQLWLLIYRLRCQVILLFVDHDTKYSYLLSAKILCVFFFDYNTRPILFIDYTSLLTCSETLRRDPKTLRRCSVSQTIVFSYKEIRGILQYVPVRNM
jgi:hypothetical protein